MIWPSPGATGVILARKQRSPNRLLAALPASVLEQVHPAYRPIELEHGLILGEPGVPQKHVYFPTTAVISSVAVFADGRMVEMATTGCEGMVSTSLILGSNRTVYRNIVQVPGEGVVMDVKSFRRLRTEVPEFRDLLLAYTRAFLAQVMQSVACNAVHSVEMRGARWLLMTQDRCGKDSFLLTQEFLGEMLGVSRVAVNKVARTLQKAGLITYQRGCVTVLDRSGLEDASCECYRVIRQLYDQTLSRPFCR
jgi:CRP-like cAMP-binding protein